MLQGAGGGFEALLKGSAPASGPKQLKGLNLRKGSHNKPSAQLHPDSSSKDAVANAAQSSLKSPRLQPDAAEDSDQPSTTAQQAAEHSNADVADTSANGNRPQESVSMPLLSAQSGPGRHSSGTLMGNAEQPGALPEPPSDLQQIATESTHNGHSGLVSEESDSSPQPLTEEAKAGAIASGDAQVSSSCDPRLVAAEAASQPTDSQADHESASRLASQAEPADAISSAISGVRSVRAFWEALGDMPSQATDDCARPLQRKVSKAAGSTFPGGVGDESLTKAAPSSGVKPARHG